MPDFDNELPTGVFCMNKSELIAAVAEDAGISKADAGRALEATISRITTAVSGGDSVALPGFGTFSVAERAAREGRNPKTGEKMAIPSSKSPKFKPGTAFKASVNG